MHIYMRTPRRCGGSHPISKFFFFFFFSSVLYVEYQVTLHISYLTNLRLLIILKAKSYHTHARRRVFAHHGYALRKYRVQHCTTRFTIQALITYLLSDLSSSKIAFRWASYKRSVMQSFVCLKTRYVVKQN